MFCLKPDAIMLWVQRLARVDNVILYLLRSRFIKIQKCPTLNCCVKKEILGNMCIHYLDMRS